MKNTIVFVILLAAVAAGGFFGTNAALARFTEENAVLTDIRRDSADTAAVYISPEPAAAIDPMSILQEPLLLSYTVLPEARLGDCSFAEFMFVTLKQLSRYSSATAFASPVSADFTRLVRTDRQGIYYIRNYEYTAENGERCFADMMMNSATLEVSYLYFHDGKSRELTGDDIQNGIAALEDMLSDLTDPLTANVIFPAADEKSFIASVYGAEENEDEDGMLSGKSFRKVYAGESFAAAAESVESFTVDQALEAAGKVTLSPLGMFLLPGTNLALNVISSELREGDRFCGQIYEGETQTLTRSLLGLAPTFERLSTLKQSEPSYTLRKGRIYRRVSCATTDGPYNVTIIYDPVKNTVDGIFSLPEGSGW